MKKIIFFIVFLLLAAFSYASVPCTKLYINDTLTRATAEYLNNPSASTLSLQEITSLQGYYASLYGGPNCSTIIIQPGITVLSILEKAQNIPPASFIFNCQITGAYFSTSPDSQQSADISIPIGNTVYLVADGTGCDGQKVSFHLNRQLFWFALDEQDMAATFVNGKAVASWQPLSPQNTYYFTANGSLTSSNKLISLPAVCAGPAQKSIDDYTKNTATGPIACVHQEYCLNNVRTDSCNSQNTVLKFFCQGGFIYVQADSCPNGCSDGACIRKISVNASASQCSCSYADDCDQIGNNSCGGQCPRSTENNVCNAAGSSGVCHSGICNAGGCTGSFGCTDLGANLCPYDGCSGGCYASGAMGQDASITCSDEDGKSCETIGCTTKFICDGTVNPDIACKDLGTQQQGGMGLAMPDVCRALGCTWNDDGNSQSCTGVVTNRDCSAIAPDNSGNTGGNCYDAQQYLGCNSHYVCTGTPSVNHCIGLDATSCANLASDTGKCGWFGPCTGTADCQQFISQSDCESVSHPAGCTWNGPKTNYTPQCSDADINQDGTVDGNDTVIVQDNVGQTGCSLANSWCNGTDVNKDSIIDNTDVSLAQGFIGCMNANLNSTSCAGGCMVNGVLIPVGDRTQDSYCDFGSQLMSQKPDNEPCVNNYECQINLCVAGACYPKALWEKSLNS